jgi:hypothetical protein
MRERPVSNRFFNCLVVFRQCPGPVAALHRTAACRGCGAPTDLKSGHLLFFHRLAEDFPEGLRFPATAGESGGAIAVKVNSRSSALGT